MLNLSFSFQSNKKETGISPIHFIQTKWNRSISQSLLFISFKQTEDGQSLLFISFKQKGDRQSLLFISIKQKKTVNLSISSFHFDHKRKQPTSPFYFNQTKRRRSISQSLLFISIKQNGDGQSLFILIIKRDAPFYFNQTKSSWSIVNLIS